MKISACLNRARSAGVVWSPHWRPRDKRQQWGRWQKDLEIAVFTEGLSQYREKRQPQPRSAFQGKEETDLSEQLQVTSSREVTVCGAVGEIGTGVRQVAVPGWLTGS